MMLEPIWSRAFASQAEFYFPFLKKVTRYRVHIHRSDAVFRRVNPSGEAVEQADMIIFLQLLDRQADGRLSQMQAVRCEGDAFC